MNTSPPAPSSFFIRRRWALLAGAVLLLAPFWGGGVLTNVGLLAWRQGDRPATYTRWLIALDLPGAQSERVRLASIAALHNGDGANALDLATAAVRPDRPLADLPSAPVPVGSWPAALTWFQLGEAAARWGDPALALAAWRQAGAAPYFCTQAARALYLTSPPDLVAATAAATTCTALDADAGPGWLILGQAQAAQRQDALALAALERAYTTLLAAGQRGRAAVAASTAAAVAATDPPAAATWTDRARALAPTVCADLARPRDPNLDALCAPR